MANPEQLRIIKEGGKAWNMWRSKQGLLKPILTGVDLKSIDLSWIFLAKADLTMADLTGANLSNADLTDSDCIATELSSTDLTRARLARSNLSRAKFQGAKLVGANLAEANLSNADLSNADLRGADLTRANLTGTNFTSANLSKTTLYKSLFYGSILNDTEFENSRMGESIFNEVNLSRAISLETIKHSGSSSIGIDTLYRSEGNIPEAFLKGCGVPDFFLHHIPSLIEATQAFQFYSCFISYSTNDEEFAKRLHSRMQAAKLRVWFAPEDIKGGHKIVDQIDTAIRMYDKLLLVLSESSMKSKWVVNEIRRARKAEEREGRRKLFPIRLVDYEKIEEWEEMTSIGEDLAEEIQSYYIPDFTNWKDHDAFEATFEKLLRDLKAEEEKP